MDWKSIIGAVAPWIGTALGGPLGGMAVEAAANALGISEKTTDAVKQALSGATPEQMLALKNADQAFSLQMQALGFKQITDLEAIAAGDRASARKREVDTKDSLTPRLLALAVTVGFFGVLGFLLANGKPAAGGDALMVMLGSLGAAWVSMVAYYFGTTSSAARTTELLASSTPGK